jgi:AraC-like DNA-binding protein
MSHFYSEPWLAYHLRKLQSLGATASDCHKIAGLNTEWISEPLSHHKIPAEAGNQVIRALYEAGYHARHEVQDMVDSFQKIDFHKAFLFNSPDVDSMLQKIQRILAHDLSGNTYRIEQRHGMLYLYHSCDQDKREFLTPQGHFAFLYQLFETAFLTNDEKLEAEVGILHASLPDMDTFSRLISPNIRCRAEQSYIAFPLRQLQANNARYNPLVDAYLDAEYRKRYQPQIQLGTCMIEDIRRQLSLSMEQGLNTVSIESIASRLEMSRSTLYRHLVEHSITFSQLLEQERKSKALAFLKETSLSMGEISDRLGYANLSAFNRAFKRWFDTNPSAIRA